jgi:hypothetical protein
MEDQMANDSNSTLGTGAIQGSVTDATPSKNPVVGARLVAFGPVADKAPTKEPTGVPASAPVFTDANGMFSIEGLQPGFHWVSCDAFGPQGGKAVTVVAADAAPPDISRARAPRSAPQSADFSVPLGLSLTGYSPITPGGTRLQLQPGEDVIAGTAIRLHATIDGQVPQTETNVTFASTAGTLVPISGSPHEMLLLTEGVSGLVNTAVTFSELRGAYIIAVFNFIVVPPQIRPISGEIGVRLQRPASVPTPDLGLWTAIRTHAKAISFGGIGVKGTGGVPRGYQGFIEHVLCDPGKPVKAYRPEGDPCGPAPDLGPISERAKQLPMHGMAAYELLKTATEIFLLWNCGVLVRQRDALGNVITTDDDERARSGLDIAQVTTSLANYLGSHRLPYIERVVQTAFPGYVSSNSVFCTNVLTPRADCVCFIELIWSYWHEEGMLVQAMNAISRRFQNVRSMSDRDPLAHVTIDPLRPLNNLLWGYVQDEQNRLTVKRRGAEYDHEYGIALRGRAIPAMRPADSRSKFLEGFHNLLHMCSVFYKEDNDTTVIADGFALLNALKEVHLLLAQGAHNQFGDLPWTARVEMLLQQWLLARPEMRDFLQSRPMVPYTEAWMPQVDTMKTLQGWSDVTVTHFHDLAVYGEQILLSIRYGDWIDLNDENHAKNWARYFRPEIQGYIHAYRAATGIDLTNPDTVDYTMPALHLQKRLALQRAR